MLDNKIHIPPSHGVIQCPDGEIQYYTESINNKHNPYLHQSSLDEENGIEYGEIICNGERIIISINDLNKALILEYKANIVRILCLLDFFMNILVTSNIDNVIIASGIVSIISLYGYFSTFIYDRTGIIMYLIYQYLQSISKLTYSGFFIVSSISPSFKKFLIKEKIFMMPASPLNITMFILTLISQLYITYFIQDFYNILPRPRSHRIYSN